VALWLLVGLQGAVAAASLVVEIVAGRMLAPYVGMSLYTWTSVIAVVLAGFSAGHWVGGRLAERPTGAALAATGWALVAAAATTAAAVFALRWSAPSILGAAGGPVAAIVALTGAAFFLPSFFAGIPAPVLAQIAVRQAGAESGRALGAIFAAGAVGAIAGTLAAGFVFVSWLGSVGTLAAVTGVYLLLAAVCLWHGKGPGRRGALALVLPLALPAGLAALALARPDPCDVESDHFCIRVIDVTPPGGAAERMMVLDHLVHGGAAEAKPARQMTAHAAMLDAIGRVRLAGREGARTPRAFFVGGGTYSIPRAWAAEGVAAMTVAEIDPEVTRVAAARFWADHAQWRVVHADARRVLAAEAARYDLVIGDAFTDIAVPAHLITAEFFALVRDRLAPDGAYLMNVIDDAASLAVLAAMLRTAETVWPVVEVWADPAAGPGQRVFILVAGETPTAVARAGPEGRIAARVGAASLDALRARPGPVFTDDYAPIDRLLAPAARGEY